MSKILIVEDSKYISNSLKLILEAEGHKVVQNFDGDVFGVLENGVIDLIMLDIMLPFTNGIEIFLHLKADKNLEKIPIIILTALTNALENHPELKGVEKFITKPFENAEVVLAVKELLEGN